MGRRARGLALLLALGAASAGSAPAAAAAAAAAARVELPIREVLLSDGMRRYAVEITVGDTKVEAGLDSGSTGLRLLPTAVPSAQVEASSRADVISYGAGTRLTGVIGHAVVSLGEAGPSGRLPIQLVRAADCVKESPNCPASRVAFSAFGIQGNGLPGEGFKAIFGVNMGDAEAPNPLTALGVRRWIIELPRPGGGKAGRLILNPTEQETAGFVTLRLEPAFHTVGGGIHDAVRGCLVWEARNRNLCGPMLMDTGAPGLNIKTPTPEPPWPNETRAKLVFADLDKPVAAADIVIGRRDQATAFRPETQPDLRQPRLMVGLTPYFLYSVLYDPAAQTIGLKARAVPP